MLLKTVSAEAYIGIRLMVKCRPLQQFTLIITGFFKDINYHLNSLKYKQ